MTETTHDEDGAVETMAVLPLRDIVVFPHMIVPLFVGREKSVRALEAVTSEDKQILLVAQKNAAQDDPAADDIYRAGTVSTILQLLKLPDGTVKVLVEGQRRARIREFREVDSHFQADIEPMPEVGVDDAPEIEALGRTVVAQFEQYIKLNKKMFETLKFIAKESPVVMASQKVSGGPSGSSGDAEDKEILNYHILMIENMHHYLETVRFESNTVLAEWRGTARKEMAEHMDLYLSAIIRRPLGKLLDFLESTESLVATAPNGPSSIAERASHSKSIVKKLLSNYDSKEITKGIDARVKRVHKHFSEADDPEYSRTLMKKVFEECSKRYRAVYDRSAKIATDVYGGNLEMEFKPQDITKNFDAAV